MTKEKLVAPENIRGRLDEYQLEATEAPLGNTCVFAVAGSGKTTLMTHRIANLIYHGVPEHQILLVTFTNQAAQEMKERVIKVLDKENILVTSGTFHSIANTFLKKFEYPRKQILDQDDALSLFKKAYSLSIKKEDVPEAAKKLLSYKNMFNILSSTINHHKSLTEWLKTNYGPGATVHQKTFEKVFKKYKELKEQSNTRDFDDLIVDVYKLLKDNPVARKKLTDQYQHILVDEYQDVNWLQYNFLKLMNAHDNIFVCGDGAQSIYAFRGSRPEYIENFEKDFKDTQTYFLKKNYRSRPNILKAAENSINFNEFNHEIELIPFKSDLGNNVITLINEENQYDEARKIASIINSDHMPHEYDEIAILVRANYHTAPFERAFTEIGIPYKLIGVMSFYERAHIKDLISLLQFALNKYNLVAFDRVINLFPKIGPVTANTLYSALKDEFSFDFRKMLTKYSFRKDEHEEAIAILEKALRFSTPEDICNVFIDSFYDDYLEEKHPEDFKSRREDVRIFTGNSNKENLEDFLDELALFKSEGEETEEDKSKVTIMTVHKSKGKEWDFVFLPGLNNINYPIKQDLYSYYLNTDEVKAERNLFYVACTRAREHLYLSYNDIMLYGRNEEDILPSPFLTEALKHKKA